MTDDRAVNTVADVSLAIVLVTAAIALVAAAPEDAPASHDQAEADQTAEVLSTATLSVPYALDPVVAATAPDRGYDETELRRASHGTVATLVADAAVASLTGPDGQRLSPMGEVYEDAIDTRFEARLVGSNFETNVTAIWEPYDGTTLRGTATVGEPVPPTAEYSSVRLTVPSGFESVGSDAANESGFESVATRVADTLLEGYQPPLSTKRALESSGLERELAVFRYRQLARLIDGTAPDDRRLRRDIDPDAASPTQLNRYLSIHLADQIEANLRATYDSAEAAADAVSTGTVTVIVRTWEP